MAKSRFSKPEILAVLQKAREGVSITSLCCDNRISGATFYQWRRKFGKAERSLSSATDNKAMLASDHSTPDPAKALNSATPTV